MPIPDPPWKQRSSYSAPFTLSIVPNVNTNLQHVHAPSIRRVVASLQTLVIFSTMLKLRSRFSNPTIYLYASQIHLMQPSLPMVQVPTIPQKPIPPYLLRALGLAPRGCLAY